MAITIRRSGARVRLLREAQRLTKAEAARRAMLTMAQYEKFEPRTRHGRGDLGVRWNVPTVLADRLALALGTTVDYIATGKIADAKAMPANYPLRSAYAMFDKERRKLQADIRRHERNRKTLERTIDSVANELAVVRKMGDALATMRADDAEYVRSTLKPLGPTPEHASWEKGPCLLCDTLDELTAAAERMARGEPARPEPPGVVEEGEHILENSGESAPINDGVNWPAVESLGRGTEL